MAIVYCKAECHVLSAPPGFIVPELYVVKEVENTLYGFMGSLRHSLPPRHEKQNEEPKDQYILDYEEARRELDKLIPPIIIQL